MSGEITDWLRRLGLEQYASTFHDNAVDAEILRELTAEDLKDLGVSLVGHRRKLLAAIAALRADGSLAAEPPPVASPIPALRTPAPAGGRPSAPAPGEEDRVRGEAERRQLTVMFCDLVGSTALSSQLDPEDLRDVIGAYHRYVADTVGRFAGFVAKYMGDGVLVYFGYPVAHEDDAERAVRAGLAVIEAVGRLPAPEPLNVRLGVASGLVVVGDLIGQGSAQEQAVVGETPNLAARLQGMAQPGALVIADSTRRQVGSLFDLRDLGERALRGFTGAARVWEVLGESRIASRFEALRSREAPLVGRDEELALLLRRWDQAKACEGRVVLLSAEPGIGKSRLVEALRERIAGELHRWLGYFCSPHHSESALHPIIGQLERDADFARDDGTAEKRRKLAVLLAVDSAAGDIALVSDLLSLPAEPGTTLDLTPQQKKERTFAALLHHLEALARQQPVVMVFEDLHWMDPTSRELLDRLVARVEHLAVLLIATFRPEFQPPWVGQAHVTALTLSRLGRRDGAALVQQLAVSAAALPAEIVDEIVERSDGVPLFLEEVTKVVLEAAAGMAPGAVAAIPGARAAVPATLQASLLARLDRLGPAAREIAQTGAAIGRDFSYELIAAVVPRGESETRAALDRLVAAGLLFQLGAPPAADYQFKHALVQDTAYGTLLRGPRQVLHGRIAAAIEAHAPDRAEREPEILAYHLSEAGQFERAAVLWRIAGEQAVRRAANREAIGHFQRALALVATQPEATDRWRAELAILTQLAPTMMSVHGWSAPEAGEVVERAAEIGRRLESSADIAPAIANLWLFNLSRGRIDKAEEISADLFRMARALGDDDILLQAHHSIWATSFYRGRFHEAIEHIEAGGSLYDSERHAHHRHVYLGHDPYLCSMHFGSSTQWVLGFPDRANQLAQDSIALARRLNHAPSLANALWRACDVFSLRDDLAAVMTAATELIGLTDVHGLPMPRIYGLDFLGWALTRSGRVAEGIPRMEEAEGLLVRIGTSVQAALALGLRAEALLTAGRYGEGLVQADRALATSTQCGERAYLSRLHRLRGALLRHLRGAADPEVAASLETALAIAREQDAKGWEIGAATDLARLWAEQGRRAEAHALLAPVYGWFTEGFETADLKDAEVLLTELA